MVREDFGWLGLAGLALVAFLAATWARWPMLTADSARELYVPFQVLHGAVVYRDFYYLYGPVAPWGLAGLLATFGERLEVLYVASGLQLAAVGGLLYAVSRQVLTPRPAAVVLLLFLTHLALGRDLRGYVWPYAFAATLAVALGLLLLVCLLRHAATGRPVWLLPAGLAWGLSLVTKLEYGVAATALVGVHGLLWALRWRGGGPLRPVHLLLLALPAVGVAGSVVAVVLSQVEVATVLESVWPTRLMALFNSRMAWTGTPDSWRANLSWLVLDLAVLAALAALPWRPERRRRALAVTGCAVVGIALVLASPARLEHVLAHGHRAWLSPSSLLAFGVGVVAVVRLARGQGDPMRQQAWALMAAYGLLITLRTLGVGLNDYTPYQVPVALPLWVGVATCALPALVGTPAPSRLRAVCWGALLAVVTARHVFELAAAYGGPHEWVRGPAGGVLAPVAYARPFNETLAHLRRELRPGERVVAAPMEASLYVLLGRDNPVKEDQLFFGYLTTPAEEADFMARLTQARVRFVVLSSYGSRWCAFGVDYMPNLARWLETRCQVVAEYGGPEYRLRLYETPGWASPQRSAR